MEIEGSRKIDLEVEDDGLMNENQFSGAVNTEKEADGTLGIDANNHLPELHESTEPAQTQRNGRYNLRKSLAWDSAFFTSAGVLDPEELSSMITGPDKTEKHFLPGIQEEITGSTESISTLESDNFTLETLEDDLFVDIRASIQRSSKKTMNLANSSINAAAIEVDGSAVSALGKEEVASETKNPKSGLKKSSSLTAVRMSKSQPKQNIGQLGSGKPIKHVSSHSQMSSISKVGELNSVLPKQPKATISSIPSSTKTAKQESTGTGRGKSECSGSKLGVDVSSKGTRSLKGSVLSGARRVLPKPAVSSKSSLLGSVTTIGVQSMRSSTSSDSSSNTSSGTPAKSTLTARRNPGKSGNVNSGPSGPIPRTPSRAAPRNKPPSSSTYLMSTKIPSNVSPASPISEWSSASSTSSAVVSQRSNNSRTSLGTSSRRSTDSDTIPLDPRNHSVDRTTGRHENQGTILTTSNAKKSSTQSGTLQAPVKPSGLRMPSPKIGYFDGVKSSGRTPNGQKQTQSGLQPLFPRNGAATCSPKQSSNSKVKSAKVQTVRTGNLASTKHGSPKVTSPASSQGKSRATVNAPSVSADAKDSPSLSPGVKGNANGESCPKAEEVLAVDGIKQVVDAGTATIIKENFSEVTEDIKTASVEGSNCKGSENIDQIDILVNQNHLKKNSHPICEAAGKENSPVNYQGEGFTGGNGDPFDLKNFTSNNESIVMSKELATQFAVADKSGLLVPSSEQKENS